MTARQHRDTGFTLIEVLLVVMILGLLAAVDEGILRASSTCVDLPAGGSSAVRMGSPCTI